jgi:chromosome partitioning protein
LKTLVVANQKGGVGKTTLVVHLAHFAAELGNRVLVVDLDSQQNASTSLAKYQTGIKAHQLFAAPAITWPAAGEEKIALIEGSNALVDIDAAGAPVINTFIEHMSAIPDRFDLCLIDTPPGPGLRTSAALIFADHAVSPIDLDQYSIDGIASLMQTVTGITQRYNKKLKFAGMLPSRVNTHAPAQKQGLSELLKHYPDRVIPAVISLRSSVGEAAAERMPVWAMNKTAAREAGREMKAALSAIVERIGGLPHG